MDVGLVGLALANGILTRETSDNRRIALLQVPEVVQVAVGQDDKAGVLRLKVSPSILLADQGVLVLGLRLQHDKRKCMAVQQQEVDETVDGFLEVVSVRIEEGPGHLDMVLQDDVGRTVVIIDQSPACLLQKLVDLDPCGCFFLHALPVTSLQLLHAYSAWLLEVYHERTKRPPQARGVLAHGFPPAPRAPLALNKRARGGTTDRGERAAQLRKWRRQAISTRAAQYMSVRASVPASEQLPRHTGWTAFGVGHRHKPFRDSHHSTEVTPKGE